ncbi:protein-cysteine N-palmitoyltransferase HHAT-like [Ornithodoros turicata]|uniref:protein-cysteine N-palmitoyltransferase HHAT-like n=1 Tax=Ornithodoros turicata TaxID=34597 RepID=UPI0031397F31
MDGKAEESEEDKKPLSTEFWRYGGIWMSALVCASCYFSFKTKEVPDHSEWGFDDGLYGLSRRRDRTDGEWYRSEEAFSQWLTWFVVHPVVCQILLRYCRQALPFFYTVYTSVFMFVMLGWVPLAMYYTVYMTMYLAAMSGARVMCYLLLAFFMAAMQLDWIPKSILQAVYAEGHIAGSMAYVGLAWTVARCLSFAVDTIERGGRPPLWNSLAYVFYWPCIFIGPLTNYVSFEKELQRPPTLWNFSDKTLRIFLDLGRCFLCYFLYNVFTHYFYVGVLRWMPEVVSAMDGWSAAGYSFTTIFMFYLKYRVLYGMAVSLAALEGINLPPPPKCICHVSLCSHLWKYFDRGLHLWLVRYIYKPVLGDGWRSVRAAVGAAGSFFFIWVWHGMEPSITIWCGLNFAGILAEQIVSQFLVTGLGARFMATYSRQIRPIHASLSAASVILSATSCMFFLAGDTIGFTVTKKLLLGFPLPVVPLFLAFYCNGYAALELRDWEKSTIKDAKDKRHKE